MQEKRNSVLVDFAMSLLMIEQNLYPSEIIQELEESFRILVSDPSRRNECSARINKYVDGDDIIARMIDIVNCVNEEPPMAPEQEEYGFERRKKTRGWTIVEDNRLIMAVNEYSIVNLAAIAAFVGSGRSRSQCSQRWIRVLDPKLSKMPWKSEEDEMLLSLCKSLGTKSWMKIATQMGNRSDVQCRYRYTQLTRDFKNKSKLIRKPDSFSEIVRSNSNSNIAMSLPEKSPKCLINEMPNHLDFSEVDFSSAYSDIPIDDGISGIKMDFNIPDQMWMM